MQADSELLRWRHALRWLQRTFFVIAIFCIGGYLALHRHAVIGLYQTAYVPLLIVAAAGLALLHTVTVFALWRVQLLLYIDWGYLRTLSSYVNRLPARFIPGGIWHSFARYADIRGGTLTPSGRLARLLVTELVAVATGAAIASGVLGLVVFLGGTPANRLAISMLVGGLIGCFASTLFAPKPQRWRWLRGWSVAVFSLALSWGGVGIAFTLVAHALGGYFVACPSPELAATYTTAASVGNFAVFAPQGWGVTDMVFALLRPCPIPLPTLLSTILAFRLVTMVADLSTWAIGRAWAKWHAASW